MTFAKWRELIKKMEGRAGDWNVVYYGFRYSDGIFIYVTNILISYWEGNSEQINHLIYFVARLTVRNFLCSHWTRSFSRWYWWKAWAGSKWNNNKFFIYFIISFYNVRIHYFVMKDDHELPRRWLHNAYRNYINT